MSIDRSIDEQIKMWYICGIHTHTHNGILLSHKKEWNNAIYSNEDGPRACHTKWDKLDRERQIYGITYMWNLKKWYKWACLQKRNRLTDIENKFSYQRVKGGGIN